MSLGLALSACGSDGGNSGDSSDPVVRMQGLPADPAALPMLVMQEQKLDEKHGFKAEFLEVDPDAAANTLLLGESDVAMEQDGVTMTLAQQQGQQAQVFFPVLNTMMSMVVREDSPYQSPKDLIGKKVGHFGVDSGTTSVIAVMLKELYDIDVFKDYDLREAGPAALPELLKKGEVEAIFDYEPLGLRAVLNAPGRYLFEPAKAWSEKTGGWSPYLTNLAARTEWLNDNPDLAVAVRDAWLEAVEYIESTDYELFAEEPYKEFLSPSSDEELEGFIEYCAELPCFLTDWTEEEINHLNEWLQLMVDNDVLLEKTAGEPIAVRVEDLKG